MALQEDLKGVREGVQRQNLLMFRLRFLMLMVLEKVDVAAIIITLLGTCWAGITSGWQYK